MAGGERSRATDLGLATGGGFLIVPGCFGTFLGTCAWIERTCEDFKPAGLARRPETNAKHAKEEEARQEAIAAKARQEGQELAAKRDRYRALSPAERRKEVTRLCPASVDADCDEKEIGTLLQAIAGTPEEKILRT